MRPKPREIIRAAQRYAARKLTELAEHATPNEPDLLDDEGLARFRAELVDIADKLLRKADGRVRPSVPVRLCAACGGKLYGGRRSCRCGCWNGPKTY